MNCDSCHNENATIYLTQLVEGKMQKVNLCGNCAEEKGVTDPTGFDLADLLEGAGTETTTPAVVVGEDGESCEFCGFTQVDFKKTGRFGCGHCYQVFREGLDNLLEAMHRNSEHHGKVPEHFIDTAPPEGSDLTSGISDLHALLDEAIKIEDYEEAARLRDSIAQLEDVDKVLGEEPKKPE
ncbi:MAG: excinuclease ABC subunit B [Verrucomicrobia bacterium]|nr:excinuclease ABC subunit B [Verrucomicrobiota bacterium]